MLEERTLITVAVVVSLSGLGALIIILLVAELPEEELTAISHDRDGAAVRVSGEVTHVRRLKNGTVTLLTLSQSIERQAVLFGAANVSAGDTVVAEGEVELYEGNPELVIRLLEVR